MKVISFRGQLQDVQDTINNWLIDNPDRKAKDIQISPSGLGVIAMLTHEPVNAIETVDHDDPYKPSGWSDRFNHCVECGTTERKHVAQGRCSRCYMRMFRRTKV